jgi:hypothetical protein
VIIRVAVIEVSHGHALKDAACLRHLVTMADVALGRRRQMAGIGPGLLDRVSSLDPPRRLIGRPG